MMMTMMLTMMTLMMILTMITMKDHQAGFQNMMMMKMMMTKMVMRNQVEELVRAMTSQAWAEERAQLVRDNATSNEVFSLFFFSFIVTSNELF